MVLGSRRRRRRRSAALCLGHRGLSPGHRARSRRVTTAAVALPALEYAAKRGVLGAQLKLARIYARARDVPKDDAKAFTYYQQIADQQADISPSSPIAKYVAEAFVALGEYYARRHSRDAARGATRSYAADLFRHAASYFGNAEAQYRLARLYMNGDGVEKNVGLAVNWLATAAKKQHAASQADARRDSVARPGDEAAAGEGPRADHAGACRMPWRPARSRNGSATSIRKRSDGPMPRPAKRPTAMMPELGGVKSAAAVPAAKAKPAEIMMMPASGAQRGRCRSPASTASSDAAAVGQAAPPPPAAMGLSVGFGATSTDAGGLKP